MSGPSRRGFALIAALALLVMISVVALELTVAARPRRLAVASSAERGAGLAAATAGVEHARALLLRLEPRPAGIPARALPRALDPWSPAVGLVIGPVNLGAFTYRVELRDAYARLHLNGASEDQLRRLLLALHIDSRRADRLAQAIADWRDPDEFRRANGAEREDSGRWPLRERGHPALRVRHERLAGRCAADLSYGDGRWRREPECRPASGAARASRDDRGERVAVAP
jgi:general secretion pathway protein K